MAEGKGGRGGKGGAGSKGSGKGGSKGDSKEVEKKNRKKPTPPPMPKADYGVQYVADALGVSTMIARQRLRDAGIKKDGRVYEFGTKKAADDVVKKLKDAAPKLKKGEGGKH